MIVLTTLNARYIHSALGLRYLYAQMGELQTQTQIMEFMINQRPQDIAEQILQQDPLIVGFGLYIWNIEQSTQVMAILKALKPELKIILGGPEISYETELSPAYRHADVVIRGQADLEFKHLCLHLIKGSPPLQKIIDAQPFHPDALKPPYLYYSDEDIRQRVLYVEASRGCPFKCEFCLSALDKTAQAFNTDLFLENIEKLYQRGARQFKFVDRTFNLKAKTSQKILGYFLSKPTNDLFLHFELIPDRLSDSLKLLIQQFPAGTLQFEIGIQSFNPAVQQLISRKQDHKKTLDNLKFLRQHTQAHLHTDLIAGLPGENLDSFARGFDLLVSLQPHEIQLGILKRLRGSPIIRHSSEYRMIFNPNPPYNILSTRDMDADTLFRLNRFARYWDMIANSGRFSNSLPILLSNAPFKHFMQLTDWLFAKTAQTHQIALPRLFKLLHTFSDSREWHEQLMRDFNRTGIKKSYASVVSPITPQEKQEPTAARRQQRHLSH